MELTKSKLNEVYSKVKSLLEKTAILESDTVEEASNLYINVLKKSYSLYIKENKTINLSSCALDIASASLKKATSSVVSFLEHQLKDFSDKNKICNRIKGKLTGEIESYFKKDLVPKEDKSIKFNESVLIKAKHDEIENSTIREIKKRLAKSSPKLESYFNSDSITGTNLVETLKNNDDTIITALSNNPTLLESVFLVQVDDDFSNIASQSIGLLKLLLKNPKLVKIFRKYPTVSYNFRDTKYDNIANSYSNSMSKLIPIMPKRISKSPIGYLKISNKKYSQCDDKKRQAIDDYRNLMTRYYKENLKDIFDSHIYTEIVECIRPIIEDEKIVQQVASNAFDFYEKVLVEKMSKTIVNESYKNSELGGYFTSGSNSLNACKYANGKLVQYLTEGFLDWLSGLWSGGSLSNGLKAKIANWFKNNAIAKYFKKFGNKLNDTVTAWEKQLSNDQKKVFENYPQLVSVFAVNDVKPNIAVNLAKDERVAKLLVKYPKLTEVIVKDPHLAKFFSNNYELLLKADIKQIEWLFDSIGTGKDTLFKSENRPLLFAFLHNSNLASHIAIQKNVGACKDTIVEVAKAMEHNEDLSSLILNVVPEKSVRLISHLDDDVLTFLTKNKVGAKILKIFVDSGRQELLRTTIVNNIETFSGKGNPFKVQDADEYNKIIEKHINTFKREIEEFEKQNKGNNHGEQEDQDIVELSTQDLINDYNSKVLKKEKKEKELDIVSGSGKKESSSIPKKETVELMQKYHNLGLKVYQILLKNGRLIKNEDISTTFNLTVFIAVQAKSGSDIYYALPKLFGQVKPNGFDDMISKSFDFNGKSRYQHSNVDISKIKLNKMPKLKISNNSIKLLNQKGKLISTKKE